MKSMSSIADHGKFSFSNMKRTGGEVVEFFKTSDKFHSWQKSAVKGLQTVVQVAPFVLRKHPKICAVMAVAGVVMEVVKTWKEK